MIRTQQIPEELQQDYQDNHERRNFAFVNLYPKMAGRFDNYLSIFCPIIKAPEVTTVKKNLLEYLKLLTVHNYLKLDSHFANSIFQTLVGLSLDKHRDEFQLAMLMLANEDLQRKYLDFLVESLAVNYIDHQNLGLYVLYKLMKNSILLLEGKIKGPNVTSTSIDNLVNLCMNQIQLRSLDFNYANDCSNFLLTCGLVIKMVRKFATKHILEAVKFERVWVKILEKIYSAQPQDIPVYLINSLFGLFQQLCMLKQGPFFEKLQVKEIYDFMLSLTSRFALECENINNFWESYFKVRQSILNPPFQNINTVSLSGIFTSLLVILPKNIEEVAQKLKVADNLILCSTLKHGVTQMKMFFQIYDNPESQRLPQNTFIQASIKSLYTNIADPKDNDCYCHAMNDLNRLLQFLKKLKGTQLEFLPDFTKMYNFLGPLKIVMRKNSQFVLEGNNMEVIVEMLLQFINKTPDTAPENKQLFLDFIQQISVCIKQKVAKIPSSEGNNMSKAFVRIMDIFQKCLKNIKRNSIYLNCIRYQVLACQQFLNLILDSRFKQSFFYTQQIFELVIIRSKFDPDIKRIVSGLIKSSGKESDTKRQKCFDTLCKIVFSQQKILYIELLFDLAETHYNDEKIMKFMRNERGRILAICCTTRYLDKDSMTRNILFNITSQLAVKNNSYSAGIAADLLQLINLQPVTFAFYQKLTEVIYKQLEVLRILKKERPDAGIDIYILFMFSNLLIRMLQRMSDTQVSNQCTWIERAQIYHMISCELLKYVCDITQIDKDGPKLLKLRNEIEKHTNRVKVLKCIEQTDFLKCMVAARLSLQASNQPQVVWTSLKDEYINIEALGIKQFAQDYKNDPVGVIITFGISKKLIKHSRQARS